MEELIIDKVGKQKLHGLSDSLSEPTYFSFQQLKQCLQQMEMTVRIKFLKEISSLEDARMKCLHLLRQELNVEEVAILLVIVSMIYFTEATAENLECNTHLLQRTCRYIDTLRPNHIQTVTERLWNALKLNGIRLFTNMLNISRELAVVNETGKAIAICLVWMIVGNITKTADLYSFQQFADMRERLEDIINNEILQLENGINIASLVYAMSFLVSQVVHGQNEKLEQCGYSHYFCCKRENLEELMLFAQHLSVVLKYPILNEIVNSNIIVILQHQIDDMHIYC